MSLLETFTIRYPAAEINSPHHSSILHIPESHKYRLETVLITFAEPR